MSKNVNGEITLAITKLPPNVRDDFKIIMLKNHITAAQTLEMLVKNYNESELDTTTS